MSRVVSTSMRCLYRSWVRCLESGYWRLTACQFHLMSVTVLLNIMKIKFKVDNIAGSRR